MVDRTNECRESILIVDDDEGIAFLLCKVLERAGFAVMSAHTEKAALALLNSRQVDLVILDYRLPGERTALHLYNDMKSAGHNVPVIVVTGFSDELTVIRAMRAGVRDFVSKSKDYLTYLPEAVDRVLGQLRLERRLEDSEARFRSYMDNVPAITFIKDGDGHILYANKRFETLFPNTAWQGKTERELLEATLARQTGDAEVATAPAADDANRLCSLASRASGAAWQAFSFPIEGTIGVSMTGVVAFEVGA
jgi:two-component system, cell cycle sensor histidine kinase and response regulator CckA